MDFHRYVREHLPHLTVSREPEIVDELAQHLGDLYQEALNTGLAHEAALARAVAAIPSEQDLLAREIESASRALPGLIADRWRASHDVGAFPPSTSGSWPMFADFRRDLRYAARMLAHTPAFTFVICLTLALGIGANAVIFSAVDAVLLQRAPVSDPDSVVSIYTTSADGRDPFSTTSYPDYVDLRDSSVLQGVAVFASVPFVLQGSGGAESVSGELVSGNFFDVLGVKIPHGRAFSADEDRPGAPVRVVVLSDGTWTTRFGADPSIVGRTITLNGNAYTVIGVAPKGFRRTDPRPRAGNVGAGRASAGTASSDRRSAPIAGRLQHARHPRTTVAERDRPARSWHQPGVRCLGSQRCAIAAADRLSRN